jgi:peptide/nickel transport system substrate-binding protein
MDRRGFLKTVSAAAAVTGTGWFLAACGANNSSSSSTATTATAGGTLRILTGSFSTLDPAKSQSLAVTSSALVHRRLTTWKVTAGQDTTVVPDLATDTGKSSADGKTWTFTLKDGLKYSDGTAITAADIKYGIERSFAAAFSGGLGYHKTLLVGGDTYQGPFDGKELDSIEVQGDKTIIFHLTRAYGDWTWIASTPAFSPVPKGKGTEATYGEHPIASGPYVLSAYQKGVSATLTRNKYWSSATDSIRTALPDQIIFEIGQDATVVSQRLIADSGNDQNAFSASFVAASQLAQIQGRADVKKRLVTSKSGSLTFLSLNTKRGNLTNVKVRQAFQYAVDKTAVQVATAGSVALAGPIATTLITEGIAGREVYDLYPTHASGDAAKAKQLLSDAGFPNGLTGLDFVYSTDNNGAAQAQAIQASLAKAGINSTLRPLDSDSYYALIEGNDGTYDLTLGSWQPDFPSANSNIQPLFATSAIGNGGDNWSRYSNAEVDALIAQAQGTLDPTAAGKLWAQVDKRIMQDSPVVPVLYNHNSYLHGSKVANFVIGNFPAYPDYRTVGLTK